MSTFRNRRRQRGAVAVMVALLMLFVFIGAAGIVFDLGRLFVNKTELQNAVDACALAASREVSERTKTLAVLTRAENAGITVGNRHRHDLQQKAVHLVEDRDVTFSETLEGPYVTKQSASSKVRYVRCTQEVGGFLQWFPQLLWVSGVDRTSSVWASAVATMAPGSTACAIPLAMCKRPDPAPPCDNASRSPDAFGLCIGQWYSGRFSTRKKDNDEYVGSITGNFNWLDFTGRQGGARDIADALAGEGFCTYQDDQIVRLAEAGLMQSLEEAWDSRFGIYKKNEGKLNVESASPDFTGYSYWLTNWPAGRDAYDDFLQRRDAFVPFNLSDVPDQFNFKANKFAATSAERHAAYGADRRVVPMPVVDCGTWGPAHAAVGEGWACVLMLHPLPPPNESMTLEYLGRVGDPGVPCGTFGHSGGPSGTGPRVPTLVQ